MSISQSHPISIRAKGSGTAIDLDESGGINRALKGLPDNADDGGGLDLQKRAKDFNDDDADAVEKLKHGSFQGIGDSEQVTVKNPYLFLVLLISPLSLFKASWAFLASSAN